MEIQIVENCVLNAFIIVVTFFSGVTVFAVGVVRLVQFINDRFGEVGAVIAAIIIGLGVILFLCWLGCTLA